MLFLKITISCTPLERPWGNFKCSDGTSISKHLRCDGHANCDDNSDEMMCGRFLKFYKSKTNILLQN